MLHQQHNNDIETNRYCKYNIQTYKKIYIYIYIHILFVSFVKVLF